VTQLQIQVTSALSGELNECSEKGTLRSEL